MRARCGPSTAARSDDAEDAAASCTESVGGSLQAALASLDAASASSSRSGIYGSDSSHNMAVPTAAQRQQPKTLHPGVVGGPASTTDGGALRNTVGALSRGVPPSSSSSTLGFGSRRTSGEGLGQKQRQRRRSTTLLAQRRQDAPASEARPLVAGRSVREMQQQAQTQWHRHKAAQREQIVEEQTLAAALMPNMPNNAVPSGPHLHVLDDEEVPPSDDVVGSASQTSMGASNFAATSLRRTPARSMSWSAKRDKRDARRRSSPPMTRRRAQAEGLGFTAATPSSSAVVDAAPPQSTPTSVRIKPGGLLPAFSSNQTCDITDPSNDDLCSTAEYAALVRAREEPVGRKKNINKKARKPVRPALDLTLTEPVQSVASVAPATRASSRDSTPASLAVDLDGYSSATQASSQTQNSQPDPTELLSLPADGVVLDGGRSNAVLGSDTEDEDEGLAPHRAKASGPERLKNKPTAAQVSDRMLPAMMSTKETKKKRRSGGQRTSKVIATATAEVAQRPPPPPRAKTAVRRRGPALPLGAPLFEGFVFILLGFHTRVKRFEKLIIKHSGLLAPRPTAQGKAIAEHIDGVTHVVYCPHSSFKPDRVRVSQAMLDWCGDRREQAESVLQACNGHGAASGDGVALLDANWISDCIAACLRQDELLSPDTYRIAI